jgi:hypothetical protein
VNGSFRSSLDHGVYDREGHAAHINILLASYYAIYFPIPVLEPLLGMGHEAVRARQSLLEFQKTPLETGHASFSSTFIVIASLLPRSPYREPRMLQKIPRSFRTHANLSKGGRTLEVPPARDRHWHRRTADHG